MNTKQIMKQLKPLSVITGHYGAGKTTVAIALAMTIAKAGKQVTLIDLDVVNPYFRSSDLHETLNIAGITVIAPNFAQTNLEVPSLSAHIDAILDTVVTDDNQNQFVIIDVGGDDAGACVLGRYAQHILRCCHTCYYLINPFRYLTTTSTQMVENLREIEQASHLTMTALISNPNLGEETTPQAIAQGRRVIETLATAVQLPIAFHAVDTAWSQNFKNSLRIERLITPGW